MGLAAGRFGKRQDVTLATTALEPVLPTARGPLSMAVINLLAERAPRYRLDRIEASIEDSAPYGIDVQLSLYVCYELHCRGFAGVDPGWEWNPGLLHLRSRLEDAFLTAVRRDVGPVGGNADEEMHQLSVTPDAENAAAQYLRRAGTWQQMREYFVHRSLYHLKEGDPHAWAIPRLTGQTKAWFAAAEFDEIRAGDCENVHQRLFTDLMVAAGLDPTYLAHLDTVPAETLAVVNLMSLFSLHRQHRGAAVGHFAANEITRSPVARGLVEALNRVQAPDECRAFYRRNAEGDGSHGQIVRTRVVGDLIGREPGLEPDVVFGMRAFGVVEDRLATHLTRCWSAGLDSLRHPVP